MVYLVPRAVLEVLQQPSAKNNVQAGISGDYCWVLGRDSVWVWRYAESHDARLRTLRLPPQAARIAGQKAFVSVLGSGQATTVLVCFSSGLLVAWLDASYLTEPTTQQLVEFSDRTGAVAAFTATGDLATGPGYIAALATSQGGLFLVQGSQQGIYTKQIYESVGIAQKESRGMLGKLGALAAWTYTEAFDPGAKYIKKSPSGRPACGLHVRMVDAVHLHVYMLTDTTLDGWLVTLGMRPSEQLMWSFQNLLAAQNERKLQDPVNVSLSAAGSFVYVHVHDQQAGDSTSTFINRIAIQLDAPPVHDFCLPVTGVPAAQFRPQSGRCELHASEEQSEAVLLVGSECQVYQWSGKPGRASHSAAVLLSDDPDNMAVAAVPKQRGGGVVGTAAVPGATWLLLNATYGLMELGAADNELAATSATPLQGAVPQGPLTHEQQLQVHQLLDALVNQAAAMAQQQQPLLSLAAGLRRRLEALGVMSRSENMQVVASYSSELVDMLPKQWALGGLASMGSSSSTAGLMSQLLAEKELKHSLLLQCLADSAVLYALPAGVLRVLVENAEKLAVAASVLSLHVQVHDEQAAAGRSDSIIIQVMHTAGQLCSSDSHETLSPTELFYARPSTSIPSLLHALGQASLHVSEQAGSGLVRPGDEGVGALQHHVLDLGRLLGTAVAAAHAKRDGLQSGLRLSTPQIYAQLGQPSWLAVQPARAALDQVALACQAVRRLLLGTGQPSTASAALSDLARTNFGVTEVLLAGFAAAVAAAPTPEAKAGLVTEYKAARTRCASTLLQDASMELNMSAGMGLPPSDALVWQVEELAAAHHCFQQLFDTCELLTARSQEFGTQRLHQHMLGVGAEEGVPSTETFARYCYQRLLDDGRPADLLTLPPAFYPDLKDFLQPRPEHAHLLWPLLLRTGDWGAAVSSLSLDAAANKAVHRRLVSLAKLSAMAAGDSASVAAADEQLQLVAVQETLNNLMEQLGQEGAAAGGVMDITNVLDTALAAEQHAGTGEGALLAIQALASCAAGARDANRSKLQLAWQLLCKCTSWAAVDEQLAAVGPGDAQAAVLQAVPLYAGVAVCCGQGVFGSGQSVTDTAPVSEVQQWVQQAVGRDQRAATLALQVVQLALSDYAAEQVQ